jgi:hypothetical protein
MELGVRSESIKEGAKDPKYPRGPSVGWPERCHGSAHHG